jgi:oligopeptide/dipeptide ABC transporter ATP-binding protein
VTFQVAAGETLGIVGESGCGKSVTALSLMRLIPQPPGKIVKGSIMFDGQDILKMDDDDVRGIRGNNIAMIFQDPMTSLNPVLTISRQISEALELHLKMDKSEARKRTIELLELVNIPSAKKRVDDYPHQFSGGMRQRVMIAMALSCNPKLILADEPTTALDVTIQREILDTLTTLRSDLNLALIFVSHDLAVIEDVCDEMVVLYAGATMETGDTASVLAGPLHPYTAALQRSRIDRAPPGGIANTITGDAPAVGSWPSGCRFRNRCDFEIEACAVPPQPPLRTVDGRGSACIRADELKGTLV